jgi:hypothetical protein
MYQRGNSEDRENRVSCYAFNLDARAGGTRLGIGSHQDELQTARAGGALDSAISDTAGLVGFWGLGASS